MFRIKTRRIVDPCWADDKYGQDRFDPYVAEGYTTHNLPLLKKQRMWWRHVIKQIDDGFYEPEPMPTLSDALVTLAQHGWVLDANQAIKRWYKSYLLSDDERAARQRAGNHLFNMDITPFR